MAMKMALADAKAAKAPRAMGGLLVASACVATFAFAAPAAAAPAAATLYVATTGSGTTCTQSAPCPTIAQAITTASTDFTSNVTTVTIDVAAGTYHEVETISVPGGDSLVLQGAGATSTTVDATGKNTSVFAITSGTVTVDGVTITGGGGPVTGAGVFNDGTATLTHDIISSNNADHGGGVYNIATATLTDDTISSNNASDNGGGVSNSGTATLTDDTISSNTADGRGGAGVFNDGTATLTDDTISSNTTNNIGGGLSNIGTAGTVTLTDDTISSNTAGLGGGVSNSGTASLTDDTISSNTAGGGGGGGGLYENQGTATLIDDTISSNTASAGGVGPGGVTNFGTVILSNSILSEAPGQGGSCLKARPITDAGHNVESDDTCGLGSTDVVNSTTIGVATTLAANGSSGPETLAIGPGSSAIGEVPVASCNAVTADERGQPRPDPGDTAGCDAGAFEFQAPVVISTTTTASATPTSSDFGRSVAYAAMVAPSSGSGTPAGTVTFTTPGPSGTMVTLCSAVLSAGVAGCDSATAPVGTDTVTATYVPAAGSNFSSSSGTVTETVSKAPTTLTTSVDLFNLVGPFSATLTRTDDGAPVPGQTVTFTASSGAAICSGLTNASGVASCQGNFLSILDAVLGYDATYAGGADYHPAEAQGGLLSGLLMPRQP